MNIFVTGGTGNMQDLPLPERSVQGCDAVIHIALAQCPDSPSRITATDEEGPHPLYGVGKMERVFGLKFDGWEDLREHIA